MVTDSSLNLTILQTLQVKKLPDGKVVLTRKLLEAVKKLESLWPGNITVMMEETTEETDNVDKKICSWNEVPFNLKIVSFEQLTPASFRNQTSLVLATVGYRQNHISKICQLAGVPCIYVSEYTLKTRKQIIAVNTKNPLLLLRRNLWEQSQEQKQIEAIQLAEGLQCNGTPTYKKYCAINRDPMLFYDTRISEDMLPTNEKLDERIRSLDENKPLRLVFSGRLNKMKGADHLLDVAQELKRLRVPFDLYISGAGVLEEMMHERITREGLHDCIKMMGLPHFKDKFFPFVKENIDLFICCHRQGDPSCTYIETMSCGVPIVGYANEAFAGMVDDSKAGWVVPMDNPKLLAKKVAELNNNREEIKQMSFKSLNFARLHTFEKTFAARIEHMKSIALSEKAVLTEK